jgi:hypothetical protein
MQTNGKIINELKNKSSKEICNISINPSNPNDSELKRTISIKTQFVKKKNNYF